MLILAIIGIAVLLLVAIDVLWTTMTVSGWGPVTTVVFKYLHLPKANRDRPRWVLLAIGPFTITLTLALWLVLSWVGWFLVFSASADSVVDQSTNAPANALDRFYFVGYTLSTLGLGDQIPGGGIWRVATVIISTGGFLFLTAAISYIIPVLSEAVDSRRIALYIDSLGHDPSEILIRAWNGSGFPSLQAHLVSLASSVALQGERYLAYPVLLHFHSANRSTSFPLNTAILDEALTLMECAVIPEWRLDRGIREPLRGVVSHMMAVMPEYYLPEEKDLPSLPSLKHLREAGIPTVSDDEFMENMKDFMDRRQRLSRFIRSDGWRWKTVHRI